METKQTREPRRLYLLNGVMRSNRGLGFELMPGCLLATSENEARGAHTKFMLASKPGFWIESITVCVMPDDLVLEAADELRAAQRPACCSECHTQPGETCDICGRRADPPA